jgi:hypothetical protein
MFERIVTDIGIDTGKQSFKIDGTVRTRVRGRRRSNGGSKHFDPLLPRSVYCEK